MSSSPVTLVFLFVNVAFSIYAFSDRSVFDRFKFNVGAVLQGNEWHRLFTSGFLHGSPTHLIVNMLSLYFCGPALEGIFSMFALNGGPLPYILLYFGSLLGGDLLSLFIHRHQSSFSAVGASGAISGLIFAVALLQPDATVYLFFMLPCPIWLFAIAFVGYSLFGMRNNMGGIDHSAHLGGALLGLLITAAFFPSVAIANWVFLLILLIPPAVVLVAIALNPTAVGDPLELLKKFFQGKGVAKEPNHKPKGLEINMRASRQEEIDRLLDKVAQKGPASLSPEERRRLDELSNRGGRDSDS